MSSNDQPPPPPPDAGATSDAGASHPPQPVAHCIFRDADDPYIKILQRIILLLPVQDALRFAQVSKHVQRNTYELLTYDPFGEWSSQKERAAREGKQVHLGQFALGLPTPKDSEEWHVLEALACHAWNAMVETVSRRNWLENELLPEIRKLNELARKAHPKSGRHDNVVSVTRSPDGSALEFATNSAPDEQERQQVERLGGIVVGNYEQVPFQHTETRHMERQQQRQYVSPIGVDRTCCLFCAAQLMALDRDRFFAAAEAKDLKGYVFSKYVLYFQRHRARMWGGEVEKLFAALTPNQKVRFLSTLVGKSRGAIKLERAKHDDCGRTLREIEKYLSPAAESINSNNQTQQASADTNPDTLASTSADDDAFWAAAIAMEFDRAVTTSLEGAYPPSDAQTATATGVPAPVVGGGGGVVPTEAPTPPTVSDTRAGPGLKRSHDDVLTSEDDSKHRRKRPALGKEPPGEDDDMEGVT